MRDLYFAIPGFVLAGIFFLLALIFIIGREKACSLISGYNFKSKEERQAYDERRMSRDYRNFLLICGGILLSGALTTLFLGQLCFWISLVAWFVFFLTGVHLDDEKAFGKYKIKDSHEQ